MLLASRSLRCLTYPALPEPTLKITCQIHRVDLAGQDPALQGKDAGPGLAWGRTNTAEAGGSREDAQRNRLGAAFPAASTVNGLQLGPEPWEAATGRESLPSV